jgi:hypothetical protein
MTHSSSEPLALTISLRNPEGFGVKSLNLTNEGKVKSSTFGVEGEKKHRAQKKTALSME